MEKKERKLNESGALGKEIISEIETKIKKTINFLLKSKRENGQNFF